MHDQQVNTRFQAWNFNTICIMFDFYPDTFGWINIDGFYAFTCFNIQIAACRVRI